MLIAVTCLSALLLICEGRHWDADQMLPNERSTLDDCRLRFHSLVSPGIASPAGGEPALIKEFAHMGAIGWTQKDGKVLWNCGGTLIWMNFILTAAHCVVDHRDVRPDIVRFGDLNLETDDDNEYVQQLKIIKIYRHPLHRFKAKYHDIALMQLESPIRLHDTVCPACLWFSAEMRFTEFVATGWGSTGYLEEHTPSLLKVALKPMEISKCKTFYTSDLIRGLNSGLHENHLCAYDEKMDTCEGDSGGPLQVKLLHHTNLTPFVVAITSFGLPCGSSKPGVYTKVAPYKDWIKATMSQAGAVFEDDIFNATICALRFQKFRENMYSTQLNKSHVYVSTGSPDHIYEAKPASYLVKLVWKGNEGPQHCYGILIDENTVLTVADCVHHQGKPVSSVWHPRGIIDVMKVHVHPQYNPIFGYYNIAILRLAKLYEFIHIRPACIDYESTGTPDTVFGIGRADIYRCEDWFCKYSFDFRPDLPEDSMGITYRCGSFPECEDSSETYLNVYIEPKNETSCLLSPEYKARFPDGITNELICAGIDRFIVPGACDLKIGSSLSKVEKILSYSLDTLDEFIKLWYEVYPSLDGLVQIGRDCGYGEHLVATNIRSHLEWMERVLLPKSPAANAVQFLEPNRREADSCIDENRQTGKCVPIFRCQRKWKKYEFTKEAAFCSSISVICCPHDEIDKNAWSKKHSYLAKCPKLVNGLIPNSNRAPMVRVLNSSTHYICMAAIISDRTMLTSASCVDATTSLYVEPLGNNGTMLRVENVIPHKFYNLTDYSNDIALLRLAQSMTWSPNLHPACLWTNRTHSPLVVEMLHPFNTTNTNIEFIEVLTMYNSDCQRTHPHQLRDSHICVKYPYRKHTCLPSHSMLRWEDSVGVPYLIGLATDTRECTSWYYMMYARVAAFVDWIVDNIDEKEIKRSFGNSPNKKIP